MCPAPSVSEYLTQEFGALPPVLNGFAASDQGYNPAQRAGFCVFTEKGVRQLRNHLIIKESKQALSFPRTPLSDHSTGLHPYMPRRASAMARLEPSSSSTAASSASLTPTQPSTILPPDESTASSSSHLAPPPQAGVAPVQGLSRQSIQTSRESLGQEPVTYRSGTTLPVSRFRQMIAVEGSGWASQIQTQPPPRPPFSTRLSSSTQGTRLQHAVDEFDGSQANHHASSTPPTSNMPIATSTSIRLAAAAGAAHAPHLHTGLSREPTSHDTFTTNYHLNDPDESLADAQDAPGPFDELPTYI